MNLYEVFYDSGLTFKHCLVNGPAAITEKLAGYSEDEIKILAMKNLAFLPVDLKDLDRSQLTAAIIDKVVKVASRGREFGDY